MGNTPIRMGKTIQKQKPEKIPQKHPHAYGEDLES